MSKAKFAAAKELIDEKQYEKAREILKGIDHPTARSWENRLNKLTHKSNKNYTKLLFPLVALTIGVIGVAVILSQNNSEHTIAALPTILILPTATATNSPTITPTPTATSSSTPSPTYTLTTTNTYIPSPSATITNTQIPTSTPNFAATQEKATLIAASTQNTIREIADSTAAAQAIEASLMVPGCPSVLDLNGSPLDFIERSNRIMLGRTAITTQDYKTQRQEIGQLPYVECLATYRTYLLASIDELILSHEAIDQGDRDSAQEHMDKWSEYVNLYLEEIGKYFDATNLFP